MTIVEAKIIQHQPLGKDCSFVLKKNEIDINQDKPIHYLMVCPKCQGISKMHCWEVS